MHAGIVFLKRAWIVQVACVFEPLWVTGLALGMLSAFFSMPSKGCFSTTFIYFYMGTLFPLAAFLVYLCERCILLKWVAVGIKSVSVLFALYQFYEYWLDESYFSTFCIFPLLCALLPVLYWRSLEDREIPSKRWASAFMIFVVSLVCWIASQNLIVNAPNFWEWITKSWQALPVFIAATGLTTMALFGQNGAQPGKMWRWTGHLIALCLFAGLCFQTDSLYDDRVYSRCGFGHHWAFWIGPVESVRDGGWLLWDVPSQYGFLNILTIAALPISDAWEALYITQSILLFLVAVMVYGLLSRWGSRLHNYLFAILFTVSTVFLLPGLIPEALTGVQPWPNVGPLRYFWLFVSIWALWFYLGRKRPDIPRYRWAGSFCWVMGILWSFESGAFCSAVFVPVVCVLMSQQAISVFQIRRSWMSTLRICLPFLTIPLGMLSFSVALIWIYYKVYHGIGPDWLGYCEFAVMHVGNESLTSPLTVAQNRTEVLVATACIFASIVIWKLKTNPLSPQVAIALGVWFAFWDSLLLFVTLKHTPFSDSGIAFALALGILIPLLNGVSGSLFMRLVCYGLLPIIAFLLTITYSHPDLPRVFRTLQLPEKALARTMCPLEPSACLLMDLVGLGPEASLVCDYQGRLLPPPRHQERKAGPYTNSHSWLPKPLVMLSVLPRSRQDVYFERWRKRLPDGGWLLIERLKFTRANRIDRIRYPFLPKIIRRLAPLPVSHWNAEIRSTVFGRTAWREVTRQSTVSKGWLLLAKLRNHYTIKKIVENEHWSLYRAIPRNVALSK